MAGHGLHRHPAAGGDLLMGGADIVGDVQVVGGGLQLDLGARPASDSSRFFWPPIMIGGCGFCTGAGSPA
jgi:hypothetical protein